MHRNVVEVEIQAIVLARLPNECHLLEMRLLIDDKYHILLWHWLVVETGSDIVGEGVNAGVGSFLVPWVEEV